MNELQAFRARNEARMQSAIDEIRWWEHMVAGGERTQDHAAPYVRAEKATITFARIVLGLDSVQTWYKNKQFTHKTLVIQLCTKPFQGQNTGSIPVSATILFNSFQPDPA